MQQQDEVQSYTSSIGKPLPRFYQLMEVNVPSQEYAQLKVDFSLDKGDRFKNKKELAAHLQKKFNENIEGALVITRVITSYSIHYTKLYEVCRGLWGNGILALEESALEDWREEMCSRWFGNEGS